MATVFIGNLPPEISDSELRELLEGYGKISSLRLISRRGFAFVELTPDGAAAAVEALRGSQLKGRTLDVALERSGGGGGRPGGGRRGGRGGRRR
jgi:RNA recognition motif-containing protein